ncbi:unnamed protein product [Rhizophagus irregularis]|uniref:Uncharacterized protein n=1 Tax=Rhizophagus irregularis TaxID=588596 RepID=A0A2N1MR15_9GLOM|nr:hypothetical protein RhiirC2_788003 [Rhizophagus irregularis]CAB4393960.1 unnamed protein product [Rhizophagus irregularis]CAB5386940.1 unnamed protein product [Rhizophagus irregularis]
MRFGGYILEVLVNDVLLPERIVKVETEHIKFEPSYYVDDISKQKIFCDMHHIVEVKPKTKFQIRFRSLQVNKTKIIRGDVAINGETDQTCIEMYNKSFQIVNGFWVKKKYQPFKFPTKLSSISNIITNHYQFGGPNTISVYFYEIDKKKFPIVKNLKISSKNYNELFWNESSNLKSYEPIAVLHIHYRSTSWFNLLNNNNNHYYRSSKYSNKHIKRSNKVIKKETFPIRKKRRFLEEEENDNKSKILVTSSIPYRNKRRREKKN